MKYTCWVFSFFACFAIFGCNPYYVAIVEDSKGQMYYRADPGLTSPLELTEARRVNLLVDLQTGVLEKLESDFSASASFGEFFEEDEKEEQRQQARTEAYQDASFLQTLIRNDYAFGRIENHVSQPIAVKMYEMTDTGEKGAYEGEVYIPPRSTSSYTLLNGKKYVFIFREQRSGIIKTASFGKPAFPGWKAQYVPLN